MPKMDGYEVCRRIRKTYSKHDVSILFMTAVLPSPANIRRGLLCGGDDYLIKPIKFQEMHGRINNWLAMRRFTKHKKVYQQNLKQAHDKLKSRFFETISALVTALEEKDKYTKGHSVRVAEYSIRIAKEMGFPKGKLETLKTAAILHDVGKIGINYDILNKPASLDEKEFKIIQEHTSKGQHIVSPLEGYDEIGRLILMHHERMDGRGYHGLTAKEVPMLARIICVADAYDAMTTTRAYRRAMPKKTALTELDCHINAQFDPECVRALKKSLLSKDSSAI